MLRKTLYVIGLLGGCAAIFSGCASLNSVFHQKRQVVNSVATQPLPAYSGPMARVAVADFDVKAAKASSQIGTGLREMLVAALSNSNRFSVLERQALAEAMKEQESAGPAGSQQTAVGAEKENLKATDLIITVAVTEFEPEASGGTAGIGGGGGSGSGALGGLLGGSTNKAHMAMDIRIVDASTSEVLSATSVQGQASDISGMAGIGLFGGGVLGDGLGGYANTPMEKAIRICIVEAVRYVSQATPVNYFKY
ncbi:MAG: hypothetical protein HY761_01615 [Candidatus Omnitrophica bacterium]|nr:hypothetical protein [Candidatus Omnitrophota bacterium]